MSRAKYGDNLIKKWAFKLSKVYSSNYSFTNLKYMRQFYRLFSIGHTVCDQLSWSHYRCLLPIKNSNQCNYYINQVILNHLLVFILTFIRKTVRQILTFHFWNIEIICYLVYNYFRLV